jgi:hypothetical protein
VIASAALAGCFQSSTLVKLNPDGSGTIEESLTMNAQTLTQLSALSSMNDKDKNAKSGTTDLSDPFSEADAKAEAAKMGEGVTFVSSEKIQNGQYTGRKAVYAFKDVRKLALNEVNTPNTGSSGLSTKSDSAPMTFTFKQLPNGDGLLTIDNASAKNGSGLPGTGGDSDNPQAMQMMKMFLQGMKIDLALQVGRVVRTNVPYVQGGKVTLLIMDFDQLLADPAAFDRIQKAKTPEDTRAALKGVKGLQVNLDPQLTIEFASR